MSLRSARIFRAAALGALLSVASFPLTAQTTTGSTSSDTKEDALKLDKFVVTGSYLPLSADVQASPVISIERAQVGQSGATDVLRLLKALTPVFQGNGNIGNEVNNGGNGESYVALRNLSTLVLLNGRRPVGTPGLGGAGADLNTIPVGMIERVEILKDSASTVYGSDAIGGVINIILRKNYNGFEMAGRLGWDKTNDYRTREAYIAGGVSIPGGSITIGAQYFENTALPTTARHIAILSPAEIAALGGNPSVLPAYMSGSYPGRIGSFILAGSPLAVGAPGYNANIQSPPLRSSPSDPGQTLAQMVAAGIYIPITSTPLSQAAGGSATILNTALFGNPLILPTKRYQFVANGTKELFGKSLEFFGDFLYADTINAGSGLAPSPLSGVGANNLTIPANNPYNFTGATIGIGAAAGQINPITRLIDVGMRYSTNETNTFRFVGGFRGEINDRYSWETGFNWGRSSAVNQVFGGANGLVMNQLLTPLIQNGNYVLDSSGRPLSVFVSSGVNVPVYNYFALPGQNASSTLDALRTVLYKSGRTDLRSIDFVVRGRPFTLPAGDVAFAAGGEARRERYTAAVDGLYSNGLALGYNAASTFSGGSRRTSALFVESGVPLTSPAQHFPLLYRTDLTAAFRYEKIQPGGNARTPKIGIRWLPFDDQFVLRSTWAKGFIAPTIAALYSPPVGNAPTFTILEGNGSAGSGGSTGRLVTGQFVTASQLSNPNLPASNSKSLTAGFVYSPKQLKGFSVSVDYYKIKQDGVGALDYTAIYADLNAKGSGSIYAAGFTFADGSKLTTTAPNQVTSTNSGKITVLGTPAGDQWTDGLDIAVDYSLKTDSWGYFNFGANANVLFNYKFRATPQDIYYQYARNFTDGLNGKGASNGLLSSYNIKGYLNHAWKDFRTQVAVSYVPEVINNGTAFGNGPTAINTLKADGKAYILPSYWTADLSVSYKLPHFGWNAAKGMTLTAGARNLFDEEPPFVHGSGNGSSEANTSKTAYDIVGRFVYVELKKEF